MNGKRAKRKRKLAASQSPASPNQVADSGNSGRQSVNLPSSSQPDPSTTKFPPIIIPDNRNYTQLLANLRSALPSTSVEAKCSGKSLKLVVKSIVDFRAVQHFLSARNISFHTFALPEEREVKIVIQGIPYHTPSDAIVQELTSLGYTPTAVSVLHAGKGDNKHPVNTFLVKLLKTGNFEEVYGLQHSFTLG